MSGVEKVTLLVSSGNGPGECELAVSHLLWHFEAEAQVVNLAFDVDENRTKSGCKSAVVLLSGKGAAKFADRWVGPVLWRCKSPIRPKIKRSNWFIGVFALPNDQVPKDQIDIKDVRFERFRAGGPGGQHQNKTDSAVRAVHGPTGLTATSREARSQHRNKSIALERLKELGRARATAAIAQVKSVQDLTHKKLERGGARHVFWGPKFEVNR